MKALPGFRDFYPEEAARRRVIMDGWRRVARRFGFEEYDGPMLEGLDLYAKKNAGGEEILGQLYRFEDGGGRNVALRPEMTPTLARMAAAREKHYRKPMKWFSVGPFFRYERQQRGRLREFLQLNADIIGESRPGADAELIAFALACLREFGLGPGEVVVRLSHRGAWNRFFDDLGLDESSRARVLGVVDKLGREDPESARARLAGTGVDFACLEEFIASDNPPELMEVVDDLSARGLVDAMEVDLSIVRGLAYYTGTVFEIFDRARVLRAVAGGGRYDGLIGVLGGGPGLAATGFAMGDVVLGELMDSVPAAAEALAGRARLERCIDVYVVVADEARRFEALGLASKLREAGLRADFPLSPTKVGRQFAAAGAAGAAWAVVIGGEWPRVKLKELATRTESEMDAGEVAGVCGPKPVQ
jgi:histidyl-tRNA synthetase